MFRLYLSLWALPEFDHSIMGDKDKSRFLAERYRKLSRVAPVILVRGEVKGVWGYKRSDHSFRIDLFSRVEEDVKKKAEPLRRFLEN
ncbi:hypothetical protein DRP53_01285 [candidate division WOR-3 bacterium]|uniref:Winged helix DNA-binding domain-containing protein n=1 Tax=candidate division WOR-3 bacterium TaxID=2052148 RepID=A0A660SKZ0_UNCW3|nr:MAG: hypothetical protein DRP53_01285 [candidate division WOR-3 bacterium]